MEKFNEEPSMDDKINKDDVTEHMEQVVSYDLDQLSMASSSKVGICYNRCKWDNVVYGLGEGYHYYTFFSPFYKKAS